MFSWLAVAVLKSGRPLCTTKSSYEGKSSFTLPSPDLEVPSRLGLLIEYTRMANQGKFRF